MSAVSALTLREAILPLTQSFTPSELQTVKVENNWTSGSGANARDKYYKMYLPVCDDPSKKELFFYVIDQFLDAMSADRLHLTTGAERYSKFRMVVEGSLRLTWQTISASRVPKTTDTFEEDLRKFIATYFAPTARDDQLEYLRGATKPFTMTTEALAARIRVISRLGRLLPGSYDADNSANLTLFNTETEYKRALFSMVPTAWRIKFAETAHELDSADYTYAMLTRYLSLQEAIEKRSRGTKRTREGSGYSGGRGRGRGSGRGRGRGGYGRGNYGRGFGGRGSYGQGYGVPPGAPYGSGNRYIQAAQGGRYGPRPGFVTPNSGGRGNQTPRSGQQGSQSGASYSQSPRRPMLPQGRGPTPYFPQFMADESHYQDHSQGYDQFYAQDQFYQDYGYNGGEMYYGDEHYYQQDQMYYPEGNYYDGGDQYYGDEGTGNQDQGPSDGQDQGGNGGDNQGNEVHFLQDFGY